MARIDPARRAQIGLDRRAKSRAQLIDAARALFSTRPVDAITVEDVTNGARLSKGAFYVHFRDLDDLRAAVANDLANEIHDGIEPHRATIADPLERITMGCMAFIEHALRDPAWGGLAARGIWAFPTVAQAARRRLADDLADAVRLGRTPVIKAEVGFDLVVGTVLQAMRSASEGRLAAADVPAIAAGVLRALGVAAAEADEIVRQTQAQCAWADRPGRHSSRMAG
jgi:AcrR family transcriptional regulator